MKLFEDSLQARLLPPKATLTAGTRAARASPSWDSAAGCVEELACLAAKF